MSLNIEKSFINWMDSCLPQDITRIGVGVSGGADSLCLVHLLKKYCDNHHIKLYAFTVDHDLRKESAHEAKSVHSMLTKWGLNHQTLKWCGLKPKTGIEEKARQARYDLMYQACQKKKIDRFEMMELAQIWVNFYQKGLCAYVAHLVNMKAFLRQLHVSAEL